MKTVAMLAVMVFGLSPPLTRIGSKSPPVGNDLREQQSGRVYTPPKGSSERKAILDTLREEIRRLHRIDALFVVHYLKVQRGWAWIETSPHSADGASYYEGVSALLHKRGGRWRIAEIACAEEDNPDCLGGKNFFRKLMKRFSAAPREIFP